ncbi:poly-gamma-glutamate hydrolase family protein [Actinomadura kijaniata]|uniref:poly-gamma-glutamate hydrolase family protein n=1 Tax=Actinomadura kijaniata TaxID=46161 RepID=UPI000832FA70|nr:poly-gamma-glutamate hydrolase family protein [Actinomadura kijaniata]
MNRALPVLGLVLALPLAACGTAGEHRSASPVAAQRTAAAERADKYRNYAELSRREKEGRDYRRVLRSPRNARVAHIAVHGGGIEPPTTQLADHAAARRGDAYYSFVGLKKRGNSALHLTSTRFDEPKALKLLRGVKYTVSWHAAKGDRAVTYVGGRDTALARKVTAALRAKGFAVATPPDGIEGTHPKNIANRNARGKGLQLEISTAQRKRFFRDGRLDAEWINNPRNRTRAFQDYVKAVNSALAGL